MLFGVLISLCISTRLAFAQIPEWGQCGGMGWTGATTCATGTVCTFQNVFYSLCIPGTAAPPSTTGTTTARTTTSTSATRSTGTTSAPTSTGLDIRLLPLGDSITYGFTSSDGNGYRSILHNLLQTGMSHA